MEIKKDSFLKNINIFLELPYYLNLLKSEDFSDNDIKILEKLEENISHYAQNTVHELYQLLNNDSDKLSLNSPQIESCSNSLNKILQSNQNNEALSVVTKQFKKIVAFIQKLEKDFLNIKIDDQDLKEMRNEISCIKYELNY